jgi:peptide/nickel transport system substrate-binding protein
MKRKMTVALAAVAAGLSVLSACSGGSGGGSSPTPSASGYNAALTSVTNPSTHKGGTLRMALTNTGDSTDPGNTYYAFNWDFSRLYARPLLTYNPVPGADGLKLVPDLATGLGQQSADGLTWTYHIRSGLKFENGEPITSKDVKYAVERSTNYAPDVLPNGPTYFQTYLADPNYPGAFKDTSADKMGLTSITTPDDTTVVFHLQHPFADFDYLVTLPETAPVPPDKDTGANYQLHPISSGPYMFKGNENPNTGFTLVRNPQWQQSSDPIAKQYPDEIDVTYKVQAADIDSRLFSNTLDMDLDGTGVQTAGRARIINSKALQKNSDDPVSGFLWYAALNTQVKPLDNVDCRKAIEYAVDKTTQQTAYGGTYGGDIASTLIPPTVQGYQRSDDYEATSQPHGDIAKAKDELNKCGQPNGFTVNISARGDRPKEVSAAQGIQEALKQINVNAQIQQFPTGQYFTNYAGSPSYVHSHDMGILMMGWGPDWPEGFGFLSQIVDSRAIKQAGNSNLQETNDPSINALLDKSTETKDQAGRNQIYAQIDQKVMSDAEVLPEVYAKSLLYRPPNVTNVYVQQAYGMYDFTQMGLSS